MTKTCTKCGKECPATTEYFYKRFSNDEKLMAHCKKCDTIRMREWQENNREKTREYGRRYRKKYPERARERGLKNRKENPDYIKEWRKKHPDYEKERSRRRYSEPKYRVNSSMKNNIGFSIKENKNGRGWESLIGYTVDDLMNHLESQFTKGMTWDNYGAWHIDHIRPISDFQFESCDAPDFFECWSLWNLQPLWAFDNISKKDKCFSPPLPLL